MTSDLVIRKVQVDRGSRVMTYDMTTRIDRVRNPQTVLERYVSDVFMLGYEDRPKSASEKTGVTSNWEESMAYVYGQTGPDQSHYLSRMARSSDFMGKSYRQHEIVQSYFHDHDEFTIVTELPVWDDDLEGYRGSIDLVRAQIIDDILKIQICDVKPNARKEDKKIVFGQLYRYRSMLIQRLIATAKKYGIEYDPDPKNIDCFFFDDTHCFRLLF